MAMSTRRRTRTSDEHKTNETKLLREQTIRAKRILCLPPVVSSFYVFVLIALIIVLIVVNAIMFFILRNVSGKRAILTWSSHRQNKHQNDMQSG